MNNIQSEKSLINPIELLKELALSEVGRERVNQARKTINQILQGVDNRLLVIAGPCSIHDPIAALEFAHLLKDAAVRFEKELFLVMRVYLEKPRTSLGWKGLISDPHLDGSFDINTGLRLGRQLLLDINQLNIPIATEFLDTIIPHYLQDVIAWSAIGARTSASPLHRELASGLPMPVGFKNTTDGNINTAVDAVKVASFPQHFLSVNEHGHSVIIHTKGNSHCHIVLRGSQRETNFQAEKVTQAATLLENANLFAKLIIDCSHGNSKKNFSLQKEVLHAIIDQIASGQDAIAGVMLESNLIEGKQPLQSKEKLTYGQSITDACLSWEDTLVLLNSLAETQRIRTLKANHEHQACIAL